ncbi:MAG: transcriptional regulator, propionate catabolism operon regulatory protein [Burkholderiales bacterium]|jgi:propionate catabolism operon transcriptional regulator
MKKNARSQFPMSAPPDRADQPHIIFLISHLGGEQLSTRLSDLIRRVLQDVDYNARISIVDDVLEDALEYARQQEQQRAVTVFICAGATGSYLRRHLTTPVVLLTTAGSDILSAFSRANEMSQRVGLLLYRSINAEIEQARHLFNFELHQGSYLNAQDVQLRINELVQQGCEVIIGSPMVTEIAQRSGLPAVLLYSANAVQRALDDALALCRAERVEATKRQRLDSIVRQLAEGVIAVDRNGMIETINPTAAAMLELERARVTGTPLETVVPELKLPPSIYRGTPDIERVLTLRDRSLVVSRIPLMEDDTWTGAVITLQETTVVQRVDRTIRIHNRPRSEVAKYHISHLVGSAPGLERLRQLAERYARTGSTILITGESGTGKELLAQGIHNASPRRFQPFVAINCAALPESLLESELFGYEEGAFTGSRRRGKVGLFEAAHQGTIFLDEIGDMPLLLQTRLLRVLQEREVHRLGALDPTPVDVRVIAATNLDLRQRVEAGQFRADLYYRLNIIGLHMPPLRERLADLPALAQTLAEKICLRLDRLAPSYALLQPLLTQMAGYHWPGNIRELENVLERYLASCDGENPPDIETLRMILPEQVQPGGAAEVPTKLKSHRKAHDAELLRQAIAQCDGNYKAAANLLGISYTTLWRKMKEFQH